MKNLQKVYELLEQTPVVPSPEVKDGVAKQPDIAPGVPEAAQPFGAEADKVAEQVADEKLKTLEHPSVAVILREKPNLKSFLETGKGNTAGYEVLVGKLEMVFEKVVASYCKLDTDESKHMATGIVCSLVDALTSQLNKPASTVEESKDKKPGEKKVEHTDELFGGLMKVAENFTGAKDGAQIGGLKDLFGQLTEVFGGYSVLKDRVKSIWILMELTRRSKGVFCDVTDGKPDKTKCKEKLDWDHWIAQDPKMFVGASRIIEMATKANKDLIQPEHMDTKESFRQKLTINDNGKVSEYTFLNLLGLTKLQSQTNDMPLVLEDYFADITPDQAKNKTAAEKLVGGLQQAVVSGERWQGDRAANKAKYAPLKDNISELLKKFEPMMDKNDPDSLYATFNKRVNLIRGFFTGESFSDVKFDATEVDVSQEGKVVDPVKQKAVSDSLLAPLVAGTVAWHTASIIFERESSYNYDALNPSDGKARMPSLGLMQRNGNRAGELLIDINKLDDKILKDETNGLGSDFGAYVIDNPNDWYKKVQDWGTREVGSGKRTPNAFEKDESGNDTTTPLSEWKVNWITKMKKLLSQPVAIQASNAKAQADVKQYITQIESVTKDIVHDPLTLEDKKCMVFMGRLRNAGGARAKGFLEKNMGSELKLKTLYDAAMADPWNKEDNLIEGVKTSIRETYTYCEAMQETK